MDRVRALAQYESWKDRKAKRLALAERQAKRLRESTDKRMLPPTGLHRKQLIPYSNRDIATLARNLEEIKQARMAKEKALAEQRKEERTLSRPLN